MQISAIDKFSLIDFPWKSSCIVFTPWCNLRCKYCHNKQFVLPELIKEIKKYNISLKDFFAFLEKRKLLLDWVSICWGEPTLQLWLIDFCKKIKDMWFLVKLDTNWSNPELLKELIKLNLLDYISMDIKSSFDNYKSLTESKIDTRNYKKSINIIMWSWVDYEFRTTVCKWFHTKDDLLNIYKYIRWARKYYLQNYKDLDCLDNNSSFSSFSHEDLEEMKTYWLDYIKNIWIRY